MLMPSHSAVMKLYAVFTLHKTGWGTRSGIGDRKYIIAEMRIPLTGAAAIAAVGNAEKAGVSPPRRSPRTPYNVEMNPRKA